MMAWVCGEEAILCAEVTFRFSVVEPTRMGGAEAWVWITERRIGACANGWLVGALRSG